MSIPTTRRQFLQGVAAGTLVAALPATAPADECAELTPAAYTPFSPELWADEVSDAFRKNVMLKAPL